MQANPKQAKAACFANNTHTRRGACAWALYVYTLNNAKAASRLRFNPLQEARTQEAEDGRAVLSGCYGALVLVLVWACTQAQSRPQPILNPAHVHTQRQIDALPPKTTTRMKTAVLLLVVSAAAGDAFVLGRPLASVPPTPLLARRTPSASKGGAFW
jgi:hypothetical protein